MTFRVLLGSSPCMHRQHLVLVTTGFPLDAETLVIWSCDTEAETDVRAPQTNLARVDRVS